MIGSRLHLVSALSNLSRETPNRRLRHVVEDITEDLYSGVDLADAMEEHPRVFNNVYVNVIRSGMRSGQLSQALEHLSEYLQKSDELSKKVRSASLYPIFVCLVFGAVFNVMVFLIFPRFSIMYASLNRELPEATQLMMGLADYYVANWPFILGTGAAVIGTFVIWVSSEAGRLVWDEFKLRFPIFGDVWRNAALSSFLRTFAVQLTNKIPAVEALRLAANASSNAYLNERVLEVADRVETGSTMSQAFRDEDVFGDIVTQMVGTGEEAGTLDALLYSAAGYFDTLLFQRIQGLTALINPLLTALVGCGIAAMLVAAFLPVFDLSGNVR